MTINLVKAAATLNISSVEILVCVHFQWGLLNISRTKSRYLFPLKRVN